MKVKKILKKSSITVGAVAAVFSMSVPVFTYAEGEKDKNDAAVIVKADTKTDDSAGGKKTAKKNGWVNEDGSWKYYKDDEPYTGWHWMTSNEGEKTPHWSYFGKDGKIYTDWHKMGKDEGEKTEHWSYFGPNGWLRTGWQQMGKGTGNPDGNAEKHWSYFGDNGWLRTGWQQLGKGTGNPDGNAEKHWSYFGSNGWLRTGWQQLGKGTANPDGNCEKHWSYFGNNGWLTTGWKKLTKADGESVDHKSYFGDNGWLVTGLKKINGTLYSFDPRGWLLSEDSEMLSKAQSYSSSTKYLILVNRDKCKTAIFEGSKNNWNYNKYWSCAVGKPSTQTVTGIFRTGQKGLYFNTGTYERCWYYTRFYGSYLFHSVLYDRSSTPTVITDGTLGAKVSHGCVRLNIKDAKWIYDVIPANTTVVVYN